MGEVIHLRPQPDPREADAYRAFGQALRVAQSVPTLRNMAAAVHAYEAWLLIAFPNEADRRKVWP